MPKVRRKYSRWCETSAAKKVSCLFRRCCHRVNNASPDASCDLARPANCRLVLVSGGVSVNFCSVLFVFPPLGLWRRSPTAAASRCKSPLAQFFTGPKKKTKNNPRAVHSEGENLTVPWCLDALFVFSAVCGLVVSVQQAALPAPRIIYMTK